MSDGSPEEQRDGGPRKATAGGSAPGGSRANGPQNIATAITDVSERFTVLIHEEIELAKTEVSEKIAKLARGAVVAVAAGVFLVTALFFALIGFALLLYFVLPVGDFAYFWGFFAMALILIALGVVAGLVAAKVVKRGAPPTPQMAIEEARKIRESFSAGADGGVGVPLSNVAASVAPVSVAAPPAEKPVETPGAEKSEGS